LLVLLTDAPGRPCAAGTGWGNGFVVFGGGGGGTAAGTARGFVSLFFDDESCELFLVSWT